MSYIKQNFTEGQVLTANNLNIIEDGIKASDANPNTLFKPSVEMGSFALSDGEWSPEYYGKKTYRTGKFLRPYGNKIKIIANTECLVAAFQYDDKFKFISRTDYINTVKDTEVSLSVGDSCVYIHLMLKKNSDASQEWDLPNILVGNVEHKEYFNIRPQDDGYTSFAIPIPIENPQASDTSTWDIQDDRVIKQGYGIIALPKTYSNTGAPTRIIMYCHGGATKYTPSTTRFKTGDVEPEYWLAEGYAVLDIDGNCDSLTEQHRYFPESIQSYLCAYDWAISNYNLRTDGVFLGGRSLGAGMAIRLMNTRLPVIACCPNAPSTNPMKVLNNVSGKVRKLTAEKQGLIGTQPTWTNSNPMSKGEFDYFLSNYDRMARYNPMLNGIHESTTPEIRESLWTAGWVNGSKLDEVPDEKAIIEKLSFRTPCPVKIFACKNDDVAVYNRDAIYLYKTMMNSGQIVELRTFESSDSSTPHWFELTDSRAMTDITTIYGETVTAPKVYVEMLQFWRRYEKTI